VGAVTDALSPLLPAGFYYKTFKWPATPRWWLRYEHFIRRAAGMGRAAHAPDPDRYEHQYAHCDVLVIGGGVAGIASARRAADAGARVIVCQQSARFGGAGVDAGAPIGERSADSWVNDALAALAACGDVTLLPRTTAFGYYDDNLVGALERVIDHLHDPPPALPRQRMWLIRAKAVVLASGAIERAIAYGNNDLPGTLFAGAAATYTRRHGVRVGTRVVMFTNNDSAYASALALHEAGVEIAAIVDARSEAALTGVGPACARGGPRHTHRVAHRARARPLACLACRRRTAQRGQGGTTRLRRRRRLGRLQSHGAPVFAGARHARVRRGQRLLPAGEIADGHRAGRCRERIPGAGARDR
jgi:sarcosine oxidase subunit alpha